MDWRPKRLPGTQFSGYCEHTSSVTIHQVETTMEKNLETSCLLLSLTKQDMSKIAGVYHWTHGRKGSGVSWLQPLKMNFVLAGLLSICLIMLESQSLIWISRYCYLCVPEKINCFCEITHSILCTHTQDEKALLNCWGLNPRLLVV